MLSNLLRSHCSDSPEMLADMKVRRPQLMEVNYGNKVRWPVGTSVAAAALPVVAVELIKIRRETRLNVLF